MLSQAGDIAAVAAAGAASVIAFQQAGGLSAICLTLGEAVGHDEVDRILGAEALSVRRAGLALQQLVALLEVGLAAAEQDLELASLGLRVDLQVQEQVVGIGGAGGLLQRDTWRQDLCLQVTDAIAMHHQLQLRAAHADPPESGFDTGDGLGLAHQAGAQRQGAAEIADHVHQHVPIGALWRLVVAKLLINHSLTEASIAA